MLGALVGETAIPLEPIDVGAVGRAEFVIGLILYPIATHVLIRKGWESELLAALTIMEWMAVALIVLAIFGIAQRFALASRLARG